MTQIPEVQLPQYVMTAAVQAVQAAVAEAARLGLVWRLRPGTVGGSGVAAAEGVPVRMDGDISQVYARSMTGQLLAGQRVWCVQIPPAGVYVLGVIGPAQLAPGMLVARIRREATQSIANGGLGEFVQFDTAQYLPFGGWSAGTNPDRFTPPWPGIWSFVGRGVFVANATSRRFAGINLNGSNSGTGTLGSQSLQAPATGTAQIQAQGSSPMNGTTDYVGLRVIQNSGAALNITNSDGGSFLEAYWVGPEFT